MSETPYERIGSTYSATRRPDPRIAFRLRVALGDVESVVNLGAGTGSYEPPDLTVIPVEPSQTMIDQRSPTLARAILGSAERLPLEDDAVDAALAVFTVHHWVDLAACWSEIRRVARTRAVFLTWDPATPPFWLTRDYFPQMHALDIQRVPPLDVFDGLGGRIDVEPLEIPHDCSDGFLAAFWRRPEAYLDATVRANISAFDLISNAVEAESVKSLASDLEDGSWVAANADILPRPALDAGYRIVVCDLD